MAPGVPFCAPTTRKTSKAVTFVPGTLVSPRTTALGYSFPRTTSVTFSLAFSFDQSSRYCRPTVLRKSRSETWTLSVSVSVDRPFSIFTVPPSGCLGTGRYSVVKGPLGTTLGLLLTCQLPLASCYVVLPSTAFVTAVILAGPLWSVLQMSWSLKSTSSLDVLSAFKVGYEICFPLTRNRNQSALSMRTKATCTLEPGST